MIRRLLSWFTTPKAAASPPIPKPKATKIAEVTFPDLEHPAARLCIEALKREGYHVKVVRHKGEAAVEPATKKKAAWGKGAKWK